MSSTGGDDNNSRSCRSSLLATPWTFDEFKRVYSEKESSRSKHFKGNKRKSYSEQPATVKVCIQSFCFVISPINLFVSLEILLFITYMALVYDKHFQCTVFKHTAHCDAWELWTRKICSQVRGAKQRVLLSNLVVKLWFRAMYVDCWIDN